MPKKFCRDTATTSFKICKNARSWFGGIEISPVTTLNLIEYILWELPCDVRRTLKSKKPSSSSLVLSRKKVFDNYKRPPINMTQVHSIFFLFAVVTLTSKKSSAKHRRGFVACIQTWVAEKSSQTQEKFFFQITDQTWLVDPLYIGTPSVLWCTCFFCCMIFPSLSVFDLNYGTVFPRSVLSHAVLWFSSG